MQVTEMSLASVFGSISHVDYVCSYEKGSKKNVRDSYINPAVYLIHTYYSSVHKEKKKQMKENETQLFIEVSPSANNTVS